MLSDTFVFVYNCTPNPLRASPTKSKEIQIPLETSVTAFSELFINFIDDSTLKTKLTSIYNEKFFDEGAVPGGMIDSTL